MTNFINENGLVDTGMRSMVGVPVWELWDEDLCGDRIHLKNIYIYTFFILLYLDCCPGYTNLHVW